MPGSSRDVVGHQPWNLGGVIMRSAHEPNLLTGTSAMSDSDQQEWASGWGTLGRPAITKGHLHRDDLAS